MLLKSDWYALWAVLHMFQAEREEELSGSQPVDEARKACRCVARVSDLPFPHFCGEFYRALVSEEPKANLAAGLLVRRRLHRTISMAWQFLIQCPVSCLNTWLLCHILCIYSCIIIGIKYVYI